MGVIVTYKFVIRKLDNTNVRASPRTNQYSIATIIPQGDWRWNPKNLIREPNQRNGVKAACAKNIQCKDSK